MTRRKYLINCCFCYMIYKVVIMYLKRLELQGFKSFADKTVLEFMPGITTVIGPNGSGKSNIVDGIRWVLGEQSLKSLRGSKSDDVIFAGTQNRHSLGFAEASIVFDNQDGKLPIEYAEVIVTRKLYRNGESGYFINKTPCRLKDVLELFMDTGIGKDGYSIIGQGKIDEILSNKSEDRRHIFEEAAGIVKYRTRKAESEKKLEQTKLNLLRINDILAEIENKLEPLKQQSEKAKKFLSLRDELKDIEVGLFLYHIENYKTRLEDIQKTIDIMVEQKEGEQQKNTELQILKDTLKEEMDTIFSQIEELQNIGLTSTKKREECYSEIQITKEKIQNNQANKTRFETEIQEATERLQILEEEKQQKLDKKTNLFRNKEKFQKELEEKEKELENYSQTLSTHEKQIEEKKKRVEQNTDVKYEKLNQVSTQQASIENFEKREKNLKEEIRLTISELDETRIQKEESVKAFYDVKLNRSQLIDKLEQMRIQKEDGIKKKTEYENAVQKLAYQNRMDEARLKFLVETEKEKEGYSKTVKSLLQSCEGNQELKKGMLGVLADIMKVKKEYETAIEMALGSSLQNIVTQTEEDAKKLVEYLRKQNLGRATFLPVSSIKGKKIERLIKNDIQGVIGIAADLVKVDKKFEQIILNLLGRTVIVDNMDTGVILARQNNYNFKIVTLKGDVINPSGAITGGSVANKTVNILGRKQEIEELTIKVEEAKKKINTLTQEKQEFENSIQNLLEEVDVFEKKLQEFEISYATETQKMESIEANIAKLENKVEKLKQEQEENIKEKQKAIEQKQRLGIEIAGLEKEIENDNQKIQEFAEKNKENQKYIDDLNFAITNLKISVSSFDESGTSLDEMISRIEQDKALQEKGIENKNKQIQEMEAENENLQLKIKEIEKQIEEIRQKVDTSQEELEQLKQKRIEKNERLAQTEQEIAKKLEDIDELKNQIGKSELKKSKVEVELEQIINKMWEEYELTPNSTMEFKKPENVQETIKQVNQLRNTIKELGSVNIDSIEEYKLTKERYDFMCEQRLDLEESTNKLKKMIQDMTNTMKNQFAEQFKKINKNFGKTFTELFGGGKAELKLADEEDILNCGIEIEVQPPGKKLQNMMLLSGGEKAFTAIAILFAILELNPAPFCVLDEIEAALDDVNVYRFSDYLKKFAKNTQFLVITHRKGTMEAADTVYGITMEENGISKLLSMRLEEQRTRKS